MITLKVDESYAFDYLAILLVKYDCSKNEMLLSQAENCIDHLKDQLGKKVVDEILESEEFKLLEKTNKETFRLVDLAKTDKCLASDVDKSNYHRCLARNKLQEKFFKSKTTEIKLGYELYSSEKTK